MDHVKSMGSVSSRHDRIDLNEPDGESKKIQPIEQDILESDLPELSRQPGPPHSPQVKQENDDEINGTLSVDRNVSLFSGRFKEDLSSEDEKGVVNQVRVGESIKLKIKLEHGYHDSPGAGFPFNQDKFESNSISPLRGPGKRSIASPSSPYCRVMINPSWETSKVYHEARGQILYLHLKETVFRAHRAVLLSKIPRLPLLYTDLEPEEDDEHLLNESLHNVNLLIYWIYHECLPPVVPIKRFQKLEGTTWDPIEFYMFAEKLGAFELMDCITNAVPGRDIRCERIL